MAFWVYGRSAKTGDAGESLLSMAKTEQEARAEAESIGILIEGIDFVDKLDDLTPEEEGLETGIVKWFSMSKGFGFISGNNETEYSFNVRDTKGTELPRIGDLVVFRPRKTKKGGWAANNVKIIQRNDNDERELCQSCGKKFVPRLVTHRGEVTKSVCPYCGSTHQDFGFCFIATAVYGHYSAPEVVTLRRFRDIYLQPYLLGRFFIKIYYSISPYLAQAISKRPWLGNRIRPLLDWVARRLNR